MNKINIIAESYHPGYANEKFTSMLRALKENFAAKIKRGNDTISSLNKNIQSEFVKSSITTLNNVNSRLSDANEKLEAVEKRLNELL